jgi:hypothetical protein
MVDKGIWGRPVSYFRTFLMLCRRSGTGPVVFSAEMLRDIVCHVNDVLLDFLKD